MFATRNPFWANLVDPEVLTGIRPHHLSAIRLSIYMHFDDPLALEEALASAGGEIHIRPAKGSLFRAHVKLQELPRVGLFSIDANSFLARKDPQDHFYGFSIPLDAPFTASSSTGIQAFGGPNAHLLLAERPFHFECKERCSTLVCNFFAKPLRDYMESILLEDLASLPDFSSHVNLMSPGGYALFRSVAGAWSALQSAGDENSKPSLEEIEDELLAHFLSHADHSNEEKLESITGQNKIMLRAEEFLNAHLDQPITRERLVKEVGTSIRTLSRAFEARHGTGPMGYLRARRLDACYTHLLASSPEKTTVTNVALNAGFSHMGKFAIAFKQAFGESPSATLRKR